MATESNVLASSPVSPSPEEARAFNPATDPTQAEHLRRLELLEVEHRQRMEYARIEHERRMEVIEAEAILADVKCHRLAEEIAPSNERLLAMVGKYTAPPGTYDNEEMPY
jgi:hypothetical protein